MPRRDSFLHERGDIRDLYQTLGQELGMKEAATRLTKERLEEKMNIT